MRLLIEPHLCHERANFYQPLATARPCGIVRGFGKSSPRHARSKCLDSSNSLWRARDCVTFAQLTRDDDLVEDGEEAHSHACHQRGNGQCDPAETVHIRSSQGVCCRTVERTNSLGGRGCHQGRRRRRLPKVHPTAPPVSYPCVWFHQHRAWGCGTCMGVRFFS